MERQDAVVIGAGGGVGAAALFHLARRGVRVLGLDRFPPGHDRGSSHGDTRIIRLAYMEAPQYVPLLRRSFALWSELEGISGQTLYHDVGLLQVGPPTCAVLRGIEASAAAHGLDVETLTGPQVEARFPAFRVPDGLYGLFDRCAGYLWVERCTQAHVDAALRAGASLRSGVAVRGWRAEGQGVVVETDQGPIAAARLVIAPGAWASQLLAGLELPLLVRRKPLFWFRSAEPRYAAGPCPTFLFQLEDGSIFYGFPSVDGQALKCAEHTGGGEVRDPLEVDRGLDQAERARVEGFLRAHLPGVSGELYKHAVCMYTLTPDEHFVLDRHPQHPQVAFCAGLSGHGFKMVPVLGEVLTQLLLDGRTPHPVEFLRLDRPALRPGAARTGLLGG